MSNSPQFSAEFLDAIRARIAVSDVVGRRVKLIRRGHEHVGLSPFTSEKTPSFTVNDDKGFYHCFSSGEHGDIFTFLMKTQNMTFPEAVEALAEPAGMDMPSRSAADAQKAKRAALLVGVVEAGCAWFEKQLWSKPGAKALAYLRGRGLTDDTIRRFRLGYAPAGNGLKTSLMAAGTGEYELLETRLVSPGKEGRESFDFFRDRIMFPIMDARGRPVAFGGRLMAEAEGQPKYLNSADTPLFQKGRLLYGLSLARDAAAKSAQITVVEGYMDVIAMAQAGFTNTVAPLGTALTEYQVALLWRYAETPVLCFDGDKAGTAAMRRVADRILPLLKPGYSLQFATLPEGEDPDDMCRDGDPNDLRELLAAARPLSDVVWEQLLNDHPANTPERVAGLFKAAWEKADTIQDTSVRKTYRQFFKQKMAEMSFDVEDDVPQADDAPPARDAYHDGPTWRDIVGAHCPIVVLGHSKRLDVQYYHFADTKGQLRSLTERTMTATAISALFFGNTDWLIEMAPNKGGDGRELPGDRLPWKLTVIVPLLMRACDAAGFFLPEVSVRGPGVWPYGSLRDWPRNEERIVVHTGDRIAVWGPRDNGGFGDLAPGRRTRAGQIIGAYFYVRAPDEDAVEGPALSDEEAARIVTHLDRWEWADKTTIGKIPVAPLMVLGWFGTAFLPALVPYRPSLFLRAPSTYGKSSVMMLGEGVLGATAIQIKRASMTGIRKELGNNNPARACFIDELEKREGGQVATRLQELYDLARHVYEQDRSNQLMGDGGATGKVNTIFMMSGVNPPRLEREDANRMLLLTLQKPKVDAVSDQTFLDGQRACIELGPKFRRRMLERWPDYEAAYGAFRKHLASLGYAPRVNDTFGTILASAWLLCRPGVPSEGEAYDWACGVSTSLLVSAIDETSPSWERCFTALMTTRIEVTKDRPRMTVRDAVVRMFTDKDATWWGWALKPFGIAKVERVGHAEKRAAEAEKRDPVKSKWLAVAYDHQGLEDIFRGTDWRQGGWRTVLSQIPDAEDNHAVNFTERSKAVLIPLDMILSGEAELVEGDPFVLDDNKRAQATV